MAAVEVLTLPELLENILGHLDMKTLLLSQRVNTHFKLVIQSSKDLQEKLYFRPKSATKTKCITEVTLNPLLTKPYTRGRFIKSLSRDEWRFAIDPFRLPQDASGQRMYLCSHAMTLRNAELIGEDCMTYTAHGPIALEGDNASAVWKEKYACGSGVGKYSTVWDDDEFTPYESETLEVFIHKTMEVSTRRHELHPSLAPFIGFDWETSNRLAPAACR
ncbi:hypothetical protein B0A48_03776 [Cryoendolithus antarcticus]|uniref:F-box domain-containing protein n=1 Tax=Cryoendolithus antarcticus TaxID=1507870 RepID=A0A1V8TGH4_9PEZI|nr:hypothetical protein B0A48_03776 [Cryoendolithus antarcticus]